MNRQTQHAQSEGETEIRMLYQQLLDSWNRRNTHDFAALFAESGNVVGFDGSVIDGRDAIATHLEQIFANHPTAAYLAKIREVRLLTPEVALLRAVAGMVPPGQNDINPAVNAVQSLVVAKQAGRWQIALFQNTPAQFHGQPELAQQLTTELRELLPPGLQA